MLLVRTSSKTSLKNLVLPRRKLEIQLHYTVDHARKGCRTWPAMSEGTIGVGQPILLSNPSDFDKRACPKCRTKKTTVFTEGGARCWDCFETSQFMLLKTTLSREKMVSYDATIGVALSGGICSTTLVLILYQLLNIRASSRTMKLRVFVFHVELPESIPGGFGGGSLVKEACRKVSQGCNFEFVSMPLEQKLLEAQQCVRDVSDKAVLVHSGIRNKLVEMAVAHHCTRVLLCSSSTRLAADVVSNVVKGKGYQLVGVSSDNVVGYMTLSHQSDSSEATVDCSSVQFCRPFRDMTMRNVIRMGHRYGAIEASCITKQQFLSGGSVGDIDSLINRFVAKLQHDKISTSGIVVRTASKLKGSPYLNNIHSREVAMQAKCVLCDGLVEAYELRLQTEPPNLSEGMANGRNSANSKPSGWEACGNTGDILTGVVDEQRKLCFSCLQIARRAGISSGRASDTFGQPFSNGGNSLGSYLEWKRTEAHHQHLRNQIGAFLLPED